MSKSTPEQTFAKFFNLANDEAAPQHERDVAERKMAAWLKRHEKTKRDIQAILVKAAADDRAAQPPPPRPIRAIVRPTRSMIRGSVQPVWWKASPRNTYG
jgi:hypothetical protein